MTVLVTTGIDVSTVKKPGADVCAIDGEKAPASSSSVAKGEVSMVVVVVVVVSHGSAL